MEEESIQEPDLSDVQNHHNQPAKEEAIEKRPDDRSSGRQAGAGWPVRLLVILIVLLLASSVANLFVSHRAYESSRNQVAAIEQLAQSIRDAQRSILNLAKILEQSSQEEEEPEEDRESAGDGSI